MLGIIILSIFKCLFLYRETGKLGPFLIGNHCRCGSADLPVRMGGARRSWDREVQAIEIGLAEAALPKVPNADGFKFF